MDRPPETCPHCGHMRDWNDRVREIGSGGVGMKPGDPFPAVTHKPGWICRNPKCPKRYDIPAA